MKIENLMSRHARSGAARKIVKLKTENFHSAFTLMELLLYVGILGAISVGLIGFFSSVYQYYYDVQNKAKVSQNLRFVSQVIEQTVKSASKITQASGSTLILAMANSAQNPTEFGLENGRIYKKESSGAKIYLTPASVEATVLDFSFLSARLAKTIEGQQWAWSGGASSNPVNEGVGWIDFNPPSSDVKIPIGSGDFLGSAYIPSLDSYLSLNCINYQTCSDVDYKVYSDASGVLRGWAWNDSVGWLSFNSLDTTSTVPYAVSISSSTGDFLGWAWSDTIGWVSFNCANPELNSCAAVSYKVQANRRQGTPTNTVSVSMTVRSRTLLPRFAFSDSYEFSVPVMPVSNITITNISPSAVTATTTVNITAITGTNFQSGATTKLARSGFQDIAPTTECVFVSSTSLQSCVFNLSGKQTGLWDVVVTNPDGYLGILPRGFEIQ